MEVVLKGALYGGVLSLVLGPVFFALIQTSIHRGFSSALFMSVGVALSDITYIAISFFGVSLLTQNENFTQGMGLAGGVLLISFGANSILTRPKSLTVGGAPIKPNHWTKQIFYGYILNGVNPFVIFFWASIASKVAIDFNYSTFEAIVFYSALAGVVWVIDVLKIYFASKLRSIITHRFISILNLVVGLALVGFGLKLLYFVFAG